MLLCLCQMDTWIQKSQRSIANAESRRCRLVRPRTIVASWTATSAIFCFSSDSTAWRPAQRQELFLSLGSAMVYVPESFIPEYRVARKYPLSWSNGWWLNRWPFLGWLETAIKAMAWLVVPYIPLPNVGNSMAFRSWEHRIVFICQTVLMFGVSSLLSLAIIDRLFYREIIAMIFVFPMNWSHWSVTVAMYRYGPAGIDSRYFRVFCWLMLLGDIVKLLFFSVHDFRILNVARYVREAGSVLLSLQVELVLEK